MIFLNCSPKHSKTLKTSNWKVEIIESNIMSRKFSSQNGLILICFIFRLESCDFRSRLNSKKVKKSSWKCGGKVLPIKCGTNIDWTNRWLYPYKTVMAFMQRCRNNFWLLIVINYCVFLTPQKCFLVEKCVIYDRLIFFAHQLQSQASLMIIVFHLFSGLIRNV
jgi:hypothetical protein